MHAKITAYKNLLILDLIATASNEEVATTLDNPDLFGQMIMNTKKNLGVSSEAAELLKTIKPGHDSIGNVDWFVTTTPTGVTHAFGWIGGPKSIVDPTTCESSRDFVFGDYITIPNDVPEDAKAYIDAK